MSLKLNKTVEGLSKTNWNIAESMRQAGYAPSTCRSGATYKSIRRYTQRIGLFDSERTKKKILKCQKKFLKDNDNSNLSRMIELEARISVPELRRTEIENKNPDKIVIVYDKKHSSDEKIIQNDDSPSENKQVS